MTAKKILFFSPFAYIWPHALAEAQLGKLLLKEGRQVEIVGCRKSYSTFCTSMESAGLDINADDLVKQNICTRCVENSEQIRNWLGNVSFFISGDDDEHVSSLFFNKNIIPQDSVQILNFEYDGINIGRLALYEVLIKYKKFDMVMNSSEREYFEISFLNAMKTVVLARNMLQKQRPDVVVCYSPQYVIPGVFAAVAKSEGIRVIFIEGSSNDIERYSYLRMWDWFAHGLSQPALSVPEKFDTYKPSKSALKRVSRLMDLRRSSLAFSSYSKPSEGKDPYKALGLDKNKKYVLMGMSSYDEVFSGLMIDKLPFERFEGKVFKNQIEWLQATIAWFAEREYIQLVVRPHPREFPNKRENVTSPHVNEWENLVKNLPPNVKIDHPSIGFPLHDHFNFASAFITGWSSTGIEAMGAGIPVITYDENLPTFPKSIHYSGKTKACYFKNIQKVLSEECSKKSIHMENAKKWLAYTFEVGTVKTGGRHNDRFAILNKLRLSRYLSEPKLHKFDLFFTPSRSDVARICNLIDGQSTSLFDA